MLASTAKINHRSISNKIYSKQDLQKIVDATKKLSTLSIYINDDEKLMVSVITEFCRKKKA